MDQACIYDGEFEQGRFCGAGIYETTLGRYNGEFLNGLFDGEGILYLPNNQGRYEGIWEKGKLVEGKYIFNDDLVYEGKELYIKFVVPLSQLVYFFSYNV